MPGCKRLLIVGHSVAFALATAWTSAGCGALIGLDPGEPIGIDANPSEASLDDASLDMPADRSSPEAGDEPTAIADASRETSTPSPAAEADTGVDASRPQADAAVAPATTTPLPSNTSTPPPPSTATAPPPSTSSAPCPKHGLGDFGSLSDIARFLTGQEPKCKP
jgi:hypothetical protein